MEVSSILGLWWQTGAARCVPAAGGTQVHTRVSIPELFLTFMRDIVIFRLLILYLRVCIRFLNHSLCVLWIWRRHLQHHLWVSCGRCYRRMWYEAYCFKLFDSCTIVARVCFTVSQTHSQRVLELPFVTSSIHIYGQTFYVQPVD